MDENGQRSDTFKNNHSIYIRKEIEQMEVCSNDHCPTRRKGGESNWIYDEEEGSRICAVCGAVTDGIMFDADMEFYNREFEYGQRVDQYKRPYHFNERFAQYMNEAPEPFSWVVEGVFALLEAEAKALHVPPAELARKIDSYVIKRYCRELKASKFSERWVFIMYETHRKYGVYIPRYVPPPDIIDWVKAVFAKASATFSNDLFEPNHPDLMKAPKKSNLSRHNFLNYNFCFHQIFYQKNMRQVINCHFFFPLLKTYKVNVRLLEMWALIAQKNSWPYINNVTDLVDPNYTNG